MNSITAKTQNAEYEIPVTSSTAVVCRDCATNLTCDEILDIEESAGTIALNCGHTAHTKGYVTHSNVALLKSSSKFLNIKEILNTDWFHATNVSHWYEKVHDSRVLVHLGTQEAAYARADCIEFESPGTEMLMHRVRLRKNVSVTGDIILDEDQWNEHPLVHQHKVNRYVNTHENIGNISLIVSAQLFEVVESFEI